MHCYETSTPRAAFGIAAVVMSAMTIGVLVVMPANTQANRSETPTLAASYVTTLASASAVTGATLDVVAMQEPASATAPCTPAGPYRTPDDE